MTTFMLHSGEKRKNKEELPLKGDVICQRTFGHFKLSKTINLPHRNRAWMQHELYSTYSSRAVQVNAPDLCSGSQDHWFIDLSLSNSWSPTCALKLVSLVQTGHEETSRTAGALCTKIHTWHEPIMKAEALRGKRENLHRAHMRWFLTWTGRKLDLNDWSGFLNRSVDLLRNTACNKKAK